MNKLSLLLLVTSIIILILVIVNLNFIIFSEATVNKTSAAQLTATGTTTLPTVTASRQIIAVATQKTPQLTPLTSPPLKSNGSAGNLTNISGPDVIQAAETSININSLQTLAPEPGLSALISNSSKGKGIDINARTNNSLAQISLEGDKTSKVSILTGGNSIVADVVVHQTDQNASNLSLLSSEVKMATTSSNDRQNESITVDSSTQSPSDNSSSPCSVISTPDRASGNGTTSNDTSRYFDIDYASRTFEDSMQDKNAISLSYYLNGFRELMKFFHSLGSIFLFVTSDLEAKIGILESYRNNETTGCNLAYLTIQSTIEYETKENLLRDSKRPSGARTILRLHRALEFLSALMLNLSKLEEDSETAPAAREAYQGTLSKHHPWTIRTIASFAMRTLPHKRTLVESVLGKEHSTNDTLTNIKILRLANVTETLFNIVDSYYDEKELKDLP